MKKITTLVLPIAGLGKRLLPLTAATPKNLIPVNGKPMLEYVLEEAVESKIKKVVLIVNPKNLKDFRAYLAKNKKRFPSLTFYIRIQETPGGNGHAIAQAYDIVKGQPFAVRFCDDILVGRPAALSSLIKIFEKYQTSIVHLEEIPKKDVSRYGVVGFEKGKTQMPSFGGGKIYKINKIIEKPKAKDAPSNLIIVGHYILTPDILRNLKLVADTLPVVADDALPLAVALQIELIVKGSIYGWVFPGKRLDCGTLEKLQQTEEYLRAHK